MIDEKWLDVFRQKHGYRKEKYGTNDPTLVILGESHGHIIPKDLERLQQRELIEKLRPKYILIETLQATSNNIEYYRKLSDSIDDDALEMIPEKYEIELIRCDLSSQEFNNKARELGILTYLTGFGGFETDERLYKPRETKMGEIIIKYSKISCGPLIAIIGHHHAAIYSEIHNVLKEKVDYFTLWKND